MRVTDPVGRPAAVPAPPPSSARAAGGAGRRALAWLLALPLLLAALVLGGAGAASAHAVLESSNPASGSTLSTAPATVTLRFSEGVEIGLGGVKVFDPAGTRVDNNQTKHGPDGDTSVVTPLRGGLPTGTYTVAWRAVSADSHPISGAFTFNIGQASGGVRVSDLTGQGSTATDVLERAATGVAYLSFAVLGGAVLFLLIARPAAIGRFRVWLLLSGAWGGLLLSSLAVLMLHGPNASGLGLSSAFDAEVLRATLDTKLGKAIAARVLLLGAAGALLGWLIASLAHATGRTRHVLTGVWAVLCTAIAITWPIADHASVGRQVELAMAADTLHLLAMTTWLGGLAVVVTLILRPGEPAPEAGLDVPTVRIFSRTAFVAVCALVATGLYASWRQVGSFAALFDTTFGLLLVFKVDLVLLMLAGAWVSRRWLMRQLEAAGKSPLGKGSAGKGSAGGPKWAVLRKAVAIEAALAIAVLGVTTVLTDTEPGRTAHERKQSEAAGPVSRTVPFDAGGAAGKGKLDVTVDPARVGPNELHVYLSDPIGRIREVEELTVTMALPGKGIDGADVQVRRGGPGHWLGDLSMPMAGRWELSFAIRTSDVDRITVTVPVEVK
ncbi:copper resistance protein CopC [Embleya scabrispora]|uniref:copper resistance CopC/CopD family protein n=1 Tax=Embleya scabrispora TaxID=159449 RepID=UPI00035C2861|nr:copper resistance protein CopC [Embleya scabrispora]MYS79721.1 copper resistance protein CopC [Streptomyces sp. SID5474]